MARWPVGNLRRPWYAGDMWIQFSQENPEVAAALWPRVLDALRTSDAPNLHIEVFLQCAQQAESVESFYICIKRFADIP